MLFYDIWPQNNIGDLPTRPYSFFSAFREPEQTKKEQLNIEKKMTNKDKNTKKNDKTAKVRGK